MISTTSVWKNHIATTSLVEIEAEVTLTNGAFITLDNSMIMEGTLNIKDEICDVGSFGVGGVIAKEISFDIANFDGRFNGYDFNDAVCDLYLRAGEERIEKGIFTIHSSKTIGYRISVFGYDEMGDSYLDTPITDPFYFSGQTCMTAVKIGLDFSEIASFPNDNYVLPTLTAEDLENMTMRDMLGYICEICGCYARFNNWGRLEIKSFLMHDFASDLDGGNFSYSPTAVVGEVVVGQVIVGSSTREDDADGGTFLYALSRNLLPYPYVNRFSSVDGLDWAYWRGLLQAIGTANADTEFILNYVSLPVGDYVFGGCYGTASDSTYWMALYKRNGNSWDLVSKNYEDYTSFTVTDENDVYKMSIHVKNGTYMGNGSPTDGFHPTIMSADGEIEWDEYNGMWGASDDYDGGLFIVFSASGAVDDSDAQEIAKIMTNPSVYQSRMIVTGVHVTGNEIDATAGTSDYMIEISNNPLVTTQAVATAVASNVLSVVGGVNFIPFTVSWSADPSYEAGDLVYFEYLGRKYVTISTNFDYTLCNLSNTSCDDGALQNGTY